MCRSMVAITLPVQARTRRVQLQIESGRFNRLLLGTGQPREAAREGVGYPKFQLALSTIAATSGVRFTHITAPAGCRY
jgi:hypothetical protein